MTFSASAASSRGQFQTRVIENVPLCREHYRLVLAVHSFPATEPGQFVQASCREPEKDYASQSELTWEDGQVPTVRGEEFASPVALLRRPFSLAGRVDRADGSTELHLIHRVVGVGTDWLSRLKPGNFVDVLGPLGNRFALPGLGGKAIMVGGGVGIPPMLYLAEKLSGRDAVVFAGALSYDLFPLTIEPSDARSLEEHIHPRLNVAEFARHGVSAVLTTDDGSLGFRGFVTQALERYLDQNPNDPSHPTIIYTCGPEPMMKRVAEIAAARNIECQVAVERAMACGMGTCQSCCIRVKKPDPAAVPLPRKDWCWRLACTDGPVFRGTDLLW